MKAKLIVFKNDQVISNIDLGKDGSILEEFILGRNDDCQVILDSPKVSRYHAALVSQNNIWTLSKKSDLGSVFINGDSLGSTPIKLNSGDLISISPFQIQIQFENSNNLNQPQVPIDKGSEAPSSENLSEEKNTDSSNVETVLLAKNEETPASDTAINNPETSLSNENNNFSENSSVSNSSENTESKPDNFGNFDESNQLNSQTNSQPSLEGGTNDIVENELVDSGDKTQIFTDFSEFILELSGEGIPYDQYLVKDREVFIGRDNKKCQIVLRDSEVSSVHSLIRRENAQCILKDLGSSNGTILNGRRINESVLNHGDEFIVGNTTFTFHVKSKLVDDEKSTLMPVEDVQTVEVMKEVEEEVSFLDDEKKDAQTKTSSGSLFSKDALKDPQKRKKILYALVALIALYVFLGDEDDTKTTDNKNGEKTENKDKTAKVDEKKPVEGTQENKKRKKKFTQEEIEYLESSYTLAKDYFSKGMYKEAEFEINKIFSVSEDGYKEAKQLKKLIQEGYKQISILEQKKQKEIEEQIRKKKVDELLEKAKSAVQDKKVDLAESLFSKILELDPEQPDVGLLKMEIESWKKEKEKKEIEEAQKKAERKRQEDLASPGKTHYLKKEWYKAIIRLDEFLQNKGIDDDLIGEATKMLKESKQNLDDEINPILAKAHSLKEGQDLKGAYEQYLQILLLDPNNLESLNEISSIRDDLEHKARKIYWEGIIAESLSLFTESKEKFQQVQQISPTDGHYYKKATEKLKKYLD